MVVRYPSKRREPSDTYARPSVAHNMGIGSLCVIKLLLYPKGHMVYLYGAPNYGLDQGGGSW